ncbi:MAG: type II toxin-antitoxin system VapC family toxin [Caulobacteraceae bacterium]
MILVDSNVIIDVLGEDAAWVSWSEAALSRAADADEIAINPIIYAEVSMGYVSIEELESRLGAHEFRRVELPYSAAFIAGRAFMLYRRRGGSRTSPLSDFYIGAHAAVSGMRLLTRDPRRYLDYFPALDLISPDLA